VQQLQIIKQNVVIPQIPETIPEFPSIQTPQLTQPKEQENTAPQSIC